MSVRQIETPRELTRFGTPADDLEDRLDAAAVQSLAEIFETPLTGAYNWDYTIQDDRIRKLYELGKELNWNATLDVPWDATPDFSERPPLTPAELAARAEEMRAHSPFNGFEPYERMSDAERLEFGRHMQAWSLSQFLHGEQGALLVASQLVSCAPTFNAKLYAGSQTFDEARHVEAFNTYLQRKIGFMYPISRSLKLLLDKILTDPRWDLKFIGMQIIIEGLALAAFNTIKSSTPDPVLRQLVHLVIRDEARHVTFGVNYLEEWVRQLSDEEREARAQFAFEACVVMRERLIATDVFRHFDWPVEEAFERATGGEERQKFRNLIFSRVVPNLKRIGLLTETIRPRFEELGILQFETLPDDADTSWEALSAPLYEEPA